MNEKDTVDYNRYRRMQIVNDVCSMMVATGTVAEVKRQIEKPLCHLAAISHQLQYEASISCATKVSEKMSAYRGRVARATRENVTRLWNMWHHACNAERIELTKKHDAIRADVERQRPSMEEHFGEAAIKTLYNALYKKLHAEKKLLDGQHFTFLDNWAVIKKAATKKPYIWLLPAST
jgi:hypothetical protein